MESLVLASPVGQGAVDNPSIVLAVGAAIMIILAIRLFTRSLQPLCGLLKVAAAMGLAMLLMIAALLLVLMSLFE